MSDSFPIHVWLARARLALLLIIVVLGFGVAALEKWRHDEAYRVWGTVYQGFSYVLDPARNTTRGVVQNGRRIRRLWTLDQRNRALKRELTRLQQKHQITLEKLGRLERLTGLGRWSAPRELEFLPADVIGFETDQQQAVLIVNRGEDDGVRPRDPVVAMGGLVGIVRAVAAGSSHIQALTDPGGAIGAVVRQNRARGIVYGSGRGRQLEFIPENEAQPIEPGHVLVTSGFERSVYPKGIVIGEITQRALNTRGVPFGMVDPAVRFDRVEEVLIVMPRKRTLVEDSVTSPGMGRFRIGMPSSTGSEGEAALTSPTLARFMDRAATDTLTTPTQAPADPTTGSQASSGSDSSREEPPSP